MTSTAVPDSAPARGMRYVVVVIGLSACAQPEAELVDDGPGKPVGIAQMIGRRPIEAFGNSDGDFQMLEYTSAGRGRHLALIVHHTDAEREWAYDRGSHVGRLERGLDEAATRGSILADIKRDWQTIYPTR